MTMRNKIARRTISFLGGLLFVVRVTAHAGPPATDSRGAIELGAPFRDNAVLQREMPVPIWGWSRPGTSVIVQFAGQTKTAVAGEGGKWVAELDALDESFEPRELIVVVEGGVRVVVENVLVGEVWLASGQSNMQWKVGKSSSSGLRVEDVRGVVPIREFEVTSVVAMLHPIERAVGAWKNGDYEDYSAIAFAFAHKLHRELDVPVGILNCSFSQTSIQAWVPRIGFRAGKDDYTRAIYRKILETDPTTPEHESAWSSFYSDIERTLTENAERVSRGDAAQAISTRTPGNMSGNRDASWLFNGRLNPVVPYAIRGAIWNQGYANMGEGLSYYNNLRSLVRGWRLVWNRPALPVYFHQFYCPGQKGESDNSPSIDGVAEMRLGTWLARDIPGTGMASQIDITGSIHYWNKAVPGQRLALHALKNQYGVKVVADGPMFRSYKVDGSRVIVEFVHAAGGLVVAETHTNADRRNKQGTGFADPKVIENGDERVKLFYLADERRVWHPANMRIEGERVVLTSPDVEAPRGVSYATGGVGFQPNLYNRALLPATPFIYYDHELVTSESWPDDALKIAGLSPDPNTSGKMYEWRKMPLLSTQFRDNAVLQAGVPITFWGSAQHDHGQDPEGEASIRFSFAGVERTVSLPGDPALVSLGPGESRFSSGREWRITVPPMEASRDPKTLKVALLIDGELVHERVVTNIVIGDVWYVAAPSVELGLRDVEPGGEMVRVLTRKAKRSVSPRPSRYSVAVSRTPKNRFASEWGAARGGLPGLLGQRIHEQTRRPVGIIFMQNAVSRGGANPELKSWIAARDLGLAPSLAGDYEDLAAVLPGNAFYDANARRYVAAWKRYWGEDIPRMMSTRSTPEGLAWGSYPTLTGSVTSEASQTYNVLVHSFTPCGLRGIIFVTSPEMFAGKRGAVFPEQIKVLASSWKRRFGGDPHFFFTVPDRSIAPGAELAQGVDGTTSPITVSRLPWDDVQVRKLVDRIVSAAYKRR